MYFRIQEERFKMTTVSHYKKGGQSSQTKKWYLSIWFSNRERMFTFDTEQELNKVVEYLDNIFKVQVI